MKFAFRADASFRIGTGHVSRCLTLADHLREAGHDVVFVSRELDGNINARLLEAGLEVWALPRPVSQRNDAEHSHANPLGVSVDTDVAETAQVLSGFHADWLIADSYGIDVNWQRAIRSSVDRVMVIDDLANRRHDCEILLDQNLFFAGEARYQGLVPDSCQLLIGPQYALINSEYATRRSNSPRDRTSLVRVLVYFGGGDTAAALLKTLAVLAEPEFAGIGVDVIANPQMTGFADVQAAADRRASTVLHRPLPHLADLTEAADLAIGGGGASTWERMCLGLPAIIVVMAENQRVLAAELAQRGLTTDLGDIASLSAGDLREAIRQARRPGVLAAMSEKLRAVCDGSGVRRVGDRLTLAG